MKVQRCQLIIPYRSTRWFDSKKHDCVPFTEEIDARPSVRTRAASFARAIDLTPLELHVRFKICLSAIQSFLLLKHVKCFI